MVEAEMPRTKRVSRAAGFWLMGISMFAIMAAGGVPTPLYVVYQEKWGFAPITLTLIYAVYMIPLLIALLTVGGVSDYIGRRKVLVASYLVMALAMAVFIVADGVAVLMVARLLQGLAAGSAMGAVASGLLDLAPPKRLHLGPFLNSIAPTIGIGVGAGGSGLLVELAPAPTTTVFVIVGTVFVILAAWAWILPETRVSRPGAWASLRPRLGVPVPARKAFFMVTPAVVAAAALGGFYNAIAPSVAPEVLRQDNHIVAGMAVATLQVTATIAAFFGVRYLGTRTMLVGGSLSLVGGCLLLLVSFPTHSIVLFFVGTAFAGTGFGIQYLGALRTVAPLSPPGERAELFSMFNVVSYVSLSVPAVIAGSVVRNVGIETAGSIYLAALVALGLVAAVLKPPTAPKDPEALPVEPEPRPAG